MSENTVTQIIVLPVHLPNTTLVFTVVMDLGVIFLECLEFVCDLFL